MNGMSAAPPGGAAGPAVADGIAPPKPPPVAIRFLVRESCQNAYRELHALLDSLTEQRDPATRKRLVLDYVQRTRHRMVRLLVAVRWVGEFGPYNDASARAMELARARGGSFEMVADSLWAVHHAMLQAPLVKYAVGPAVDILTTGFFPRMPKIIASSVGVQVSPEDEPSQYDHKAAATDLLHAGRGRIGALSETYIIQRLGAATRGAVRACLPIRGGLRVVAWRGSSSLSRPSSTPSLAGSVGPTVDGGDPDTSRRAMCVAVGVRNAWRVELSLDRLDLSTAVFRVHRVHIDVAPDPDAPAPPSAVAWTSTGGGERLVLTAPQEALLRRMADDRMRAASVASRRDGGDAQGEAMPGASALAMRGTVGVGSGLEVARKRAMLEALRDLISGEFCIPLAMEHLRNQAMYMASTSWTGVIEHKAADDGGIILSYWNSSRHAAKLTVRKGKTDGQIEEDVDDGDGLLELVHEPALPGGLRFGVAPPRLNALNLEQILLNAANVRAAARLTAISEILLRQENLRLRKEDIVLKLSGDAVMLVVTVKRKGNGILFFVSSKSGAMRVRLVGAATSSIPESRYTEVGLWNGERIFPSAIEEETTATAVVANLHRRIELDSAARAMCILDVGVTRSLPPGTASVAASSSSDKPASQLVPPFAQLERRAPRRFLTLSPPPARAEGPSINNPGTSGDRVTKRPRLTYATTNDSLVFIQENVIPDNSGRIDRYSGTAVAAAAWAVAREAVERRLRRDSLIRAFSAANVASAASTTQGHNDESELDVDAASRTLLKLKCEPLGVLKGELLLRGNDSWQVRLHLVPPIFDPTDKEDSRTDGPKDTSWSIGVACLGPVLTFTYPSANAASVRGFFRDLTRARTAAALARGVPPAPQAQFYSIIHRSPIRLVVRINNATGSTAPGAPLPVTYTAAVEYVYSRGNSGGFNVTFTPSKPTMEQLAPLIEEALDASGGAIGGVLAGLLERACPVAAALESAVRDKAAGRIRFVTALRARVIFAGGQPPPHGAKPQVAHAFDVDARGGQGHATVIDVSRATAGMISQGLYRGGSDGRWRRGAPRSFLRSLQERSVTTGSRGKEYTPLPKWDQLVATFIRMQFARPQVAGSTVNLRMEVLERFLTALVQTARTSV